ncbi:MAG: DUF5777 family beta-barrel protein [Sediminibacterium sp.]|nr:DUF5777 family beta-barrel protein [Sediminibacterium sp.]
MFSLPRLFLNIFLIFLYLNTNAQIKDTSSFFSDFETDMNKESKAETEIVTKAFKSTRIINSQSAEFLGKGILDFRILHRFGSISSGPYNFYGLDNAFIRLGLDYGITDRLTIGIGRSTYQKQFDGFIKAKLLQQKKGAKNIPLSISYVGGINYASLEYADPIQNDPINKLYYFHQLLLCRKFNEYFTFQIMPTVVHANYAPKIINSLGTFNPNDNDLYSIGFGTRIRLSKRVNFTAEYFQQLNQKNPEAYNGLGLGIDIETGGHVFQINVTNAVGMTEQSFINGNSNDFFDGQIHFGFNISRVFVLKKPKEFRK